MTETLEDSHKDFKEATIKKMFQRAKANTLETYEKITTSQFFKKRLKINPVVR